MNKIESTDRKSIGYFRRIILKKKDSSEKEMGHEVAISAGGAGNEERKSRNVKKSSIFHFVFSILPLLALLCFIFFPRASESKKPPMSHSLPSFSAPPAYPWSPSGVLCDSLCTASGRCPTKITCQTHSFHTLTI